MSFSFFVKIAGIAGVIVLLSMLLFTSPTEIGPLGVLVFFTTLYITLFSAFSVLWQIFKKLAFKIDRLKRKDYLCAAVLAFAPIMLLMARSFNAINLWTLSLIAIFIFLAEFLVYKKA
ncbi:MAG: hypothetical protein Q4B87_01385 [Candidatus Saccharibacteria bacterium]|nr:hypothetical protein [Candidatus Saccharibacteria bacterium]